MTPDQLSKSGTEHAHQVALFAWAAVAAYNGFLAANLWAKDGMLNQCPQSPIPCLKWLHAVHNQGHGDVIRGGRAKAEGVRAGIPDIFLPVPKDNRNEVYENCDVEIIHGLYIELKKPSMKPVRAGSKGGLSDEQIEFGEFAKANGYAWHVAYGWQEAAKIIQEYLS